MARSTALRTGATQIKTAPHRGPGGGEPAYAVPLAYDATSMPGCAPKRSRELAPRATEVGVQKRNEPPAEDFTIETTLVGSIAMEILWTIQGSAVVGEGRPRANTMSSSHSPAASAGAAAVEARARPNRRLLTLSIPFGTLMGASGLPNLKFPARRDTMRPIFPGSVEIAA